MKLVGFTQENVENVRATLAIVCLLGELDFEDDSHEGAILKNPELLNHAAKMLGVGQSQLLQAFITTKTQVRHETYVKHNNVNKVSW